MAQLAAIAVAVALITEQPLGYFCPCCDEHNRWNHGNAGQQKCAECLTWHEVEGLRLGNFITY